MKLFKNNINVINGKIYSLDEKKEIMTSLNNSGYKTGKIKDCYGNIYHGAHEVIYAEANNLPKHLWEKPTVNHKNHIKTDNRIENLELATYPEQCDETWKENKSVSLKNSEKAIEASIKNFKIASEKNKKKVYQYTLDGKLLNEFLCVKDAAAFVGAFPQNISQCCKGKKKQIKGYRWSHFPL